MPGTPLENHGSEYEKTGDRKPPATEINYWPQEFGEVNSSPFPSPATVMEAAKSTRNEVAFPTLLPAQERLLNAREVAARLGVSERWVRDHTTRRSPKIRAVKLGTLIRYRRADVETFMESAETFHTSRQPRFGV